MIENDSKRYGAFLANQNELERARTVSPSSAAKPRGRTAIATATESTAHGFLLKRGL